MQHKNDKGLGVVCTKEVTCKCDKDTLRFFVGLARTIYIRCTYGIFGLEITKYTVYIYVYIYIRFWPNLILCAQFLREPTTTVARKLAKRSKLKTSPLGPPKCGGGVSRFFVLNLLMYWTCLYTEFPFVLNLRMCKLCYQLEAQTWAVGSNKLHLVGANKQPTNSILLKLRPELLAATNSILLEPTNSQQTANKQPTNSILLKLRSELLATTNCISLDPCLGPLEPQKSSLTLKLSYRLLFRDSSALNSVYDIGLARTVNDHIFGDFPAKIVHHIYRVLASPTYRVLPAAGRFRLNTPCTVPCTISIYLGLARTIHL